MDGEIQILIECKKSTEPVKIEHASQLFRYFAVANARIAILTNGEIYQFFTDPDAPNRMDAKPFLVLDLNDIDESLIPELQKLSKDVFDLGSIINAAGELKYIGGPKRTLAAQFNDPEDEWVKFLTGRVYPGAYTQKVREQFTTLLTKASKQFPERPGQRAPQEGSRGSTLTVPKKYIGLFGADKEETRVPIGSLEEIYEHTEALRASVKSYL
jgi:hypothetical protein